MVMVTNPTSGQIQKRIHRIIGKCYNTIHIKDFILVFERGKEHDRYLEEVLRVLYENGITCRPENAI